MPAIFPSTLYRNQAKAKTLVTVFLAADGIHIQSETENLLWLPSELQSARRFDDGSVILQNGELFLEVPDPDFGTALQRDYAQLRLFHRSFFDKIGVTGCLVAILLVAAPLLALYFWVVPSVAERAAGEVSPDTERQIGDSWYQNLITAYHVDTAQTSLAQQFYDGLGYGGIYPMKITVVHEPVVNAFALPGGHIVVFDSIIGLMDAPEQFAGLLAHEASHVQLHHSTRAIFRELANEMFLSLLLGNTYRLSGIVARNSRALAGLSYSRSLELEADEEGLQLMRDSNIPMHGMPDLFRKMQASESNTAAVPTFLSTHPGLKERVMEAEKQIASAGTRTDSIPAGLQNIWRALKRR